MCLQGIHVVKRKCPDESFELSSSPAEWKLDIKSARKPKWTGFFNLFSVFHSVPHELFYEQTPQLDAWFRKMDSSLFDFAVLEYNE